MRKIPITILFLLSVLSLDYGFISQAGVSMINYEKWEYILNNFVDQEGRVNYEELKHNRDSLDNFITAQIENADISAFSDDHKKAFWINAYNALTMQLIVDHYPLRFGGIRTINWGRPWDVKMKAAGEQLTLNDIEHKILRKWDPSDPRIHFAINCASIGCPNIPITHFNPDQLDKQLNYEAVRFINDREKVRLDREANILYHTEIFKWFKEDFLAVQPDIKSFILLYLNDSDKQYILANKDKIKLNTMKYDWGLNKQ